MSREQSKQPYELKIGFLHRVASDHQAYSVSIKDKHAASVKNYTVDSMEEAAQLVAQIVLDKLQVRFGSSLSGDRP